MRFAIASCLLLAMTARAQEKSAVPQLLSYKMKSLDGKDIDLSKYQGKVVLFVNVASRCGYTPQYKGLQALHAKYADKGLAVVGVPCNQFGKQEPGSADEIREFCTTNYGVAFDMLAKVDVNGPQQCELYRHLTSAETGGEFAGPIKWNFEKFLVGRDGKVIARFTSRDAPQSDKVVQAIEKALAASH